MTKGQESLQFLSGDGLGEQFGLGQGQAAQSDQKPVLRRKRGPRYPFFGIEAAIKYTRQILEKHRGSTTAEAMASDIFLRDNGSSRSTDSSELSRSSSTLRYYGFIRYRAGGRSIFDITERGRDVCFTTEETMAHDPQGAAKFVAAIDAAIMSVEAFAVLRSEATRNGGSPLDPVPVAARRVLNEYDYTTKSIDAVLGLYQESVAYLARIMAHVPGYVPMTAGSIIDDDDDAPVPAVPVARKPAPPAPQVRRAVAPAPVIPLAVQAHRAHNEGMASSRDHQFGIAQNGDRTFVLYSSAPADQVTREDIDFLTAYLQLVKASFPPAGSERQATAAE